MTPDQRLHDMGLALPPAPKPVGVYIPSVRTGDLVFVSGQLPTKDGQLMATGHVGAEVSLEEAQGCARQAALNALAVVAAEIARRVRSPRRPAREDTRRACACRTREVPPCESSSSTATR